MVIDVENAMFDGSNSIYKGDSVSRLGE